MPPWQGDPVRNLLFLVLGVIGLALVRNLIREITRLMARKMAGAATKPSNGSEGGRSSNKARPGRLERDPHTGTFVDPKDAVKANVEGTTFFFESESSRDAFLADRRRRA